MDNNQGFAPRQMFQGNWKCSGCGTDITELPFEPAEGRDIFCKDCYRKNRQSRGNY
ncbi:hypothetical protein KKA15_01895 [Patescibacteria group bacterium]|nr:hypothetical protein [Patescibacteria group bacterium]